MSDTLPGAGVSLSEKVDYAIAVLREFECKALELDPERGYWGADSGGKDSAVVRDLLARAGVRHVNHYNVCPDPPELQHFLKRAHPDTIWERPDHTIFWYVPLKGLPSRVARWCCELFKERGGAGLMRVCGIRAAESPRRKALWQTLTACRKTSGWTLNPILYWSSEDVWDYIHSRNLPYCKLYDEGWKRLGCVGCPMARSQQARMFARWPRIEALWRKATHKLWERRAGTTQRDGREWYASAFFSTPNEYFEWRYSAESLPKKSDDEDCQMGLW